MTAFILIVFAYFLVFAAALDLDRVWVAAVRVRRPRASFR